MRALLPVAFVVLFLALAPAVSGQEVVLIRQFGTASEDIAFSISVDASGVYVAGRTLGELPGQTNAGTQDAFVRKYDAAGTEVWTRQFGSASGDGINGISVDVSGVYVFGYTGGALSGQVSSGDVDAFVRKYDAAGTEVWTRQFGSNQGDWPGYDEGIYADASGVYVSGYTWGALPGQSSSGGTDTFVRKYDAAGNEVWTRQFGSTGRLGGQHDVPSGISVDASGVYVVGQTYGELLGQTNAGTQDAFVRKYDAAGTEVWTRQFGSGNVDGTNGISVDVSGVYVSGYTYGALVGQISSGDVDAFVRKYDAAGNEVWTRQFGTPSVDFGNGISVDASGVYVSGYTYGALVGQISSGDVDAFVRKYDAAGTEVWTRQFGTPSVDFAEGISVDASGVYVSGRTDGTLPGQTSAGSSDAFVVKLTIDPLEASFIFDPSLGTGVIVGKPVTLTGTVSGGTGTYTIFWDFGDGTGAKGNPVEHTYSAPGSRTVTLTVSDGVSPTLMVTQTVIVWRCPDVDGDTDVDIDDLIGVFLNQFTSNLQYDLDADGDIDIDDLIFVFLNQFQVTC